MKLLNLFTCVLIWGSISMAQNTGDLRSLQSGNWNSASTWQVWNGTSWQQAVLSDIPESITTKTITIKSPHIINYAQGGSYVYDLIIESGGVLKENTIGSSSKALSICHSLLCNGTFGNGSTPGKIILSFIGSNCSVSGTGPIDCYSIRAQSFTSDINLNINISITLRSTGSAVYSYNSNHLFNIHIYPGNTLTCAGDGVSPGDFNLDYSQNNPNEYGGTAIIGGNLIISGIFYASSNNVLNGCSYTINSGGSVSCKEIVMNESGSAGTILNVNSGGTLSIKGADGSTNFSSVNNTYTFDGIIEYSYSGAQTIKAMDYRYLKLSGSGVKTLQASKTISIKENGVLELGGGISPATLYLGTGSLIINNGVSLVYSAAGEQNPGVEWNYAFRNLVINKTGSLTINSSKVFPGILNLNSGKVIIGNYDLQFSGVSGGSSSSYIVENGSGKLKALVGSGKVSFPIGESVTSYTPVAIDNSGGTPDTYSVKCMTSSGGINGYDGVVNKQWIIAENNPGGSSLVLYLQWNGIDEVAPFNRSIAVIGVEEGSIFDMLSSSAVTGTDPFIISTTSPFLQDITTPKVFCVSNPAAFPVELVSFFCTNIKGSVNLEWITITENNCYGFIIERKGSNDWEEIGFVKAAGSSNSPKNYSWKEKVNTGLFSYRLKIIDFNGSFEYSKIVTAAIKAPRTFELYQNFPNPFNPSTTIKYSVPEGTHRVKLKVYNLLGDEVASLIDGMKTAGEYEITFQPDGLSSGVYLYKLTAEKFSITKKLIYIK